MLRLYIIGLTILITAILANLVASALELLSWYDFLSLISDKGSAGLTEVRIFDYTWLILLYPFVLGLGYWVGNKLFHLVSGKKS